MMGGQNTMGIQWFAGPNAPQNSQSARNEAALQRRLAAPGPSAATQIANKAAWMAQRGTTKNVTKPATFNPALQGGSPSTGGTPQTGGGYQSGEGSSGTNPLEDLLRGRIRRIRTLGAGERRDVTDAGLEQGLGRSQGAQLEKQRQREMEGITTAERDYQAGEFENQRAQQGQALQAQLEREKLNQQMQLERERAALERELTTAKFSQEASQNELERQASLDRASMSGGGGGGTEILSGTSQRRIASEESAASAPPRGAAQGAQQGSSSGGMIGRALGLGPGNSARSPGGGVPPAYGMEWSNERGMWVWPS